MAKARRKSIPFVMGSIYIRGSHTELSDTFSPTVPGQQLVGELRMVHGEAPAINTRTDQGPVEIKTYTFGTRFEFRYRTAGVQPAVDSVEGICASIRADFAVEYALTGDAIPEADQLKEWGEGTALNHIWPYWREFCHSSMQRMQLPIVLVPLLNVILSPELDPASEEAKPTKRAPARKKLAAKE